MSARTTDLQNTIDGIGNAFETFQAKHDNFVAEHKLTQAEIMDRLEALEARRSSPGKTASANSAEVKAFMNYCRTGDMREVKGMSEASTAAGGAMVPKVIADQIISRAIVRSRLASVVRTTPASTPDYRRILNLRGMAQAWSSESGTRNDTAVPTLREVTFPHGESYAVPVLTRWLMQDSQFDMNSFVSENVADTFAKALESAVVKGDGSSKPKGILYVEPVTTGDDDSPERNQDAIERLVADASPACYSESLIALYFSLKPEYRARGTWVMSSAALSLIRQLRAASGDGQFLWQASLGAGVDASDGTLLGKPVVISEELANVSTDSPDRGLPVLFGDFNVGYELVRIGDLSVVRDEVTEKGKVKLYFAQRWGGRLVDNNAIKVYYLGS